MLLLSCFIWKETRRFVFNTAVKTLFCLCSDCSEPSVMEICLTFHTWSLTCLREREYFFLYHDVIPFLLLSCFIFLSQPTWTLVVPSIRSVEDVMLLCLFTMFPACTCTYISFLRFLELYVNENHNLSYVSNIHM